MLTYIVVASNCGVDILHSLNICGSSLNRFEKELLPPGMTSNLLNISILIYSSSMFLEYLSRPR